MFDPNEVEEPVISDTSDTSDTLQHDTKKGAPFFHVLPQAFAGVDMVAVEDGLGELNVLLDLVDPPLAGSSPAYLVHIDLDIHMHMHMHFITNGISANLCCCPALPPNHAFGGLKQSKTNQFMHMLAPLASPSLCDTRQP